MAQKNPYVEYTQELGTVLHNVRHYVPKTDVTTLKLGYNGTIVTDDDKETPLNYIGNFRTSLASHPPYDGYGRLVKPETDPSDSSDSSDSSSGSSGGSGWPPKPPSGDGCYVMMYCDGKWSFEPVRDYECEESSSSGSSSSGGSSSGSSSSGGSSSGSSSSGGSSSGSSSSGSSSSGSSSSGGDDKCIRVVAGWVFYGGRAIYVSPAYLRVPPALSDGWTDYTVYVCWNDYEASIFLDVKHEVRSKLLSPYLHFAPVADIDIEAVKEEDGTLTVKKITIVQQQHGAVVQSVSRRNIWDMIFKARMTR